MENEITLEQVYSDDTGEEEGSPPEPEAEEPKAEETEQAESVDDTEESTGEPESKAKAEPPKSEEPWHLRAVLDEREKRQNMERELEELRKQLGSEEKEPTSFFDDEGKARQEVVDEIRNEFLRRELQRSERIAVREHGEELVKEATEWFNSVATKYPSLLERFHNSFNDVGEVVVMFNENKRLESAKDLESFEAKIRADERARIEAELKGRQEAKTEAQESITQSLAKVTSASKDSESTEIPSLEEIYGRT